MALLGQWGSVLWQKTLFCCLCAVSWFVPYQVPFCREGISVSVPVYWCVSVHIKCTPGWWWWWIGGYYICSAILTPFSGLWKNYIVSFPILEQSMGNIVFRPKFVKICSTLYSISNQQVVLSVPIQNQTRTPPKTHTHTTHTSNVCDINLAQQGFYILKINKIRGLWIP